MDGVVVRLLADNTGRPSYWFGRVFAAVLPDLDRLRWHAPVPPWMAPPEHFDEPGDLWRAGGLGRYWRDFVEEDIELRGFPPNASSIREQDPAALLYYWDSTCWELYTGQPGVAERAFAAAKQVPEVVAARARLDRRAEAFGFVGLGDFWRSIRRTT